MRVVGVATVETLKRAPASPGGMNTVGGTIKSGLSEDSAIVTPKGFGALPIPTAIVPGCPTATEPRDSENHGPVRTKSSATLDVGRAEPPGADLRQRRDRRCPPGIPRWVGVGGAEKDRAPRALGEEEAVAFAGRAHVRTARGGRRSFRPLRDQQAGARGAGLLIVTVNGRNGARRNRPSGPVKDVTAQPVPSRAVINTCWSALTPRPPRTQRTVLGRLPERRGQVHVLLDASSAPPVSAPCSPDGSLHHRPAP